MVSADRRSNLNYYMNVQRGGGEEERHGRDRAERTSFSGECCPRLTHKHTAGACWPVPADYNGLCKQLSKGMKCVHLHVLVRHKGLRTESLLPKKLVSYFLEVTLNNQLFFKKLLTRPLV